MIDFSQPLMFYDFFCFHIYSSFFLLCIKPPYLFNMHVYLTWTILSNYHLYIFFPSTSIVSFRFALDPIRDWHMFNWVVTLNYVLACGSWCSHLFLHRCIHGLSNDTYITCMWFLYILAIMEAICDLE